MAGNTPLERKSSESHGNIDREVSAPVRPQNKHLKRGGSPGRPKGIPNKASFEIKHFCRSITESRTYQASLKKRLIEGKAPHMEPLIFAYAYGKPVEKIQIIDRMENQIEAMAQKYGLSPEQIVQRLQLMLGGRVA
jgi:hypothetical protein